MRSSILKNVTHTFCDHDYVICLRYGLTPPNRSNRPNPWGTGNDFQLSGITGSINVGDSVYDTVRNECSEEAMLIPKNMGRVLCTNTSGNVVDTTFDDIVDRTNNDFRFTRNYNVPRSQHRVNNFTFFATTLDDMTITEPVQPYPHTKTDNKIGIFVFCTFESGMNYLRNIYQTNIINDNIDGVAMIRTDFIQTAFAAIRAQHQRGNYSGVFCNI